MLTFAFYIGFLFKTMSLFFVGAGQKLILVRGKFLHRGFCSGTRISNFGKRIFGARMLGRPKFGPKFLGQII